MNQRERVEATLRGSERDRPPVSFWRHFYEKENSASGLAEAMLAFQGKYDWDFMKVNPRASYHGEGWGLKVRFRGEEGLKPERIDYPIKDPRDWGKVKSLPLDEGALAEQIQALELIRKGLGQEIPMVQTLFTPLSIAGDLVGTADARTPGSKVPSRSGPSGPPGDRGHLCPGTPKPASRPVRMGSFWPPPSGPVTICSAMSCIGNLAAPMTSRSWRGPGREASTSSMCARAGICSKRSWITRFMPSVGRRPTLPTPLCRRYWGGRKRR